MKRMLKKHLGHVQKLLFSKTNFPAILAILVVCGLVSVADYYNRKLYFQDQQHSVIRDLEMFGYNLQHLLAKNFSVVEIAASQISKNPINSQAEFEQLVQSFIPSNSLLSVVVASPDSITKFVYPFQGNQALIGRNLRQLPEVTQHFEEMLKTRTPILSGPEILMTGGNGFIERHVIFTENHQDPEYWGMLSGIINADKLYTESQLYKLAERLELSIRSKTGDTLSSFPFYGITNISDLDPISVEVALSNSSWIISAIPKAGWLQTPPNTPLLYFILFLLGLAIIIPIFILTYTSHVQRRNMLSYKGQAQDQQRQVEHLQSAVQTSQLGIWDMNIVTGQLNWDSRMRELFGLPLDTKITDYTQWRDLLHPDDRERAEREFNESIRTSKNYFSSYRIIRNSGVICHVKSVGNVFTDNAHSPRILGVASDATGDVRLSDALMLAKTQAEAKNFELERAKARIEHNAMHDALTGLPNRRYLDEILEPSKHVDNSKMSILHMDLDRFKQVNDTLGHMAGDAMLVHASQILKSCIRKTDFLARIGGDEFVIVCREDISKELLCELSDQILSAMRRPINYNGQECRIGVSIGIAVADENITPKKLLINADIALYRAKRRGRNRYEFFSPELQAEIFNNKRIADDILAGLDHQEFFPHYQLQFCAQTLDIIGAEALARWQHPSRGMLKPDAFMDIATELNIVHMLDRIILEQALKQRQIWRTQGFDIPRISVNVSAWRLHDERLIENLKGLEIEPGTIAFELIETIYLDDHDPIVTSNLKQIRDMGIAIELDDFGTGHASILSLVQLRPDRVKIDRKLIEPIVDVPEQRALVNSIIEVANRFNIGTIAEGVETKQQAELLKELGCDALQGYGYARPMVAEDIIHFVNAQRWRSTSNDTEFFCSEVELIS